MTRAEGPHGPYVLDGADLVVVGGPTHAHGLSRVSTRQAAADALDKPDNDLELDPDAAGPGIREWLESLGPMTAELTSAARCFLTVRPPATP